MEDKTQNILEIEKAIFKAATGYEYEESEVKGNRTGSKTEIKKVKKHRQPDVRAALVYLNLFCE